MDNQIEKFDPSTLMQGVKDRIKSTFVSLIPDDKWDQLVKAEIDIFFNKDKNENGSGAGNIKVSSFSILVMQQLEIECKKRLKEYLDSVDFNLTYDQYGQKVTSETVKKMMIDNAGEIMINMFSGMFSQQLHHFRSSINQRGY